MEITWEETETFLQKTQLLRFASTKPDGRPHVTPMGYLYLEGRFYSCTYPDRAKIRNIKSNPYATLLVDSEEKPEMVVIVEGKARILQGTEEAQKIVSAFRSTLGWSLDTVIEVTPEKIIAWKEQYRTGASRFHLKKQS